VNENETPDNVAAAGGVTHADLFNIINEALAVLAFNRQFVTDAVLAKMKELLEEARGMTGVLGRILGVTPEQAMSLVAAGERFLAAEQQILKGGLGGRIERSLEVLKNRPMLLGMLAAML
jgi:hypothetical protein